MKYHNIVNISKLLIGYTNSVVGYGRMNPPHIGHKQLLEKVGEIAKENNAIGLFFLSKSHDTIRNPIPYDIKLGYVQNITPPNVHILNIDFVNDIFNVLEFLSIYKMKNIWFIAGEDRASEYENFSSYKKELNFHTFNVVCCGSRGTLNDKGVDGISGTKMRGFIRDNDKRSFMKFSGQPTKELEERLWYDTKRYFLLQENG